MNEERTVNKCQADNRLHSLHCSVCVCVLPRPLHVGSSYFPTDSHSAPHPVSLFCVCVCEPWHSVQSVSLLFSMCFLFILSYMYVCVLFILYGETHTHTLHEVLMHNSSWGPSPVQSKFIGTLQTQERHCAWMHCCGVRSAAQHTKSPAVMLERAEEELSAVGASQTFVLVQRSLHSHHTTPHCST